MTTKNIFVKEKYISSFFLAASLTGCTESGLNNKLLYDWNNCEDKLKNYVDCLANDIGPRSMKDKKSRKALNRAAEFFIKTVQGIGYEPVVHEFIAQYGDEKFIAKNIEVVIKGADPSLPIIVVGAHYDTVDESPGADDNASGIAALLEIAKYLKAIEVTDNKRLERGVRLVAFTNEERPYSLDSPESEHRGNNMGSVQYAKNAKNKGEHIYGMICLESIGYYSGEPNSQKYPDTFSDESLVAFDLQGKDKGNFLACVANESSEKFARDFAHAYKKAAAAATTDPKESSQVGFQFLCLPDSAAEIGRSDHKSFWLQDYPALMLTDSADLRNPHYHTDSDTTDALDFPKFAQVTKNVCIAVADLAGNS